MWVFYKADFLCILEIAPDISDCVSKLNHTSFKGHWSPGPPAPRLVYFDFPVECRPVRAGFRGDTDIICLAVVAEDPIQHLKGQILILYPIKRPDALHVMEKLPDPVFFAEIRKTGFAKMPVRDMTDIVTESDCFNQILIETQATANRTGDL